VVAVTKTRQRPTVDVTGLGVDKAQTAQRVGQEGEPLFDEQLLDVFGIGRERADADRAAIG